MKAMAPGPAPVQKLSLAFFGTKQGELLRGFARIAHDHLGTTGILHVGTLLKTPTGRAASISGIVPVTITPEDLGFERVPISFTRVEKELAARLADTGEGTVLAVDMGWGLQTASATANFENWMEVAQNLARLPERGSFPKELLALGIKEYRQVFFKPYRVIYRVMGEQVIVYLIVDGRRDMQAVLARRLLSAS